MMPFWGLYLVLQWGTLVQVGRYETEEECEFNAEIETRNHRLPFVCEWRREV
jgi:hypothetical protein